MKEAKVASDREALVAFFVALGFAVRWIGLEAGPLSQWLHAGLKRAGFETVLVLRRLSTSNVFETGSEARTGIGRWIGCYRPQWVFRGRTPDELRRQTRRNWRRN